MTEFPIKFKTPTPSLGDLHQVLFPPPGTFLMTF